MIVVAIIAIIAAIAIPNLLRSRMAANETAAVASCKAFATAEDIYRRTDYNHDGVLEYAQNLNGANSLYETAAGAGDVALVDRSFAQAEGAPLAVTPKSGYVFAVLTAAGANASGGSRSYLDSNSRMTLGYALSAVSNQYDGVGRNAFVISNAGAIYQKDRGTGTTGHETAFDPDSTWVIAE
jgi:type II secretory pathway pseudopilin PulG